MRVKMLKNEPGAGLMPGERFKLGSEYDVPDEVGTRWIRRMVAVAAVAPGLAMRDKSPRGKRRDTTEE